MGGWAQARSLGALIAERRQVLLHRGRGEIAPQLHDEGCDAERVHLGKLVEALGSHQAAKRRVAFR